MLQGLGGWHIVAIIFIILLLFGAPKLPGLARSLGQSMRILKKEVRNDSDSTAHDRTLTDSSTTGTSEESASEPVNADGGTDGTR